MAAADDPRREPADPDLESMEADDDEEEVFEGAIEDDEPADGDTPVFAMDTPTTPTGAPRPRYVPRQPPPQNQGIKAAAGPVLITVGVLLLVPGIWSLMYLSGAVSDGRSEARAMALIMLACWPIALILIAGGIWFILQVQRAKKQT